MKDRLFRKETLSRKIFIVINYLLITSVTLMYILPLVNVFAVSLSNNLAVSSGEVLFWPVGFTLNSYKRVIENTDFIYSLLNSIKRVALGIPISMVLTILSAYPLSKSNGNFRARKYYMMFFVITMLFGGGLIPSYMVIKNVGLYDNIFALILPVAVQAFNVILLVNFFREIPKEIEESAFLDGASHWTVLWKMYLPLSKAVLATLTLFFFVFHWNSWFDGLIYMSNVKHYPLQSYLQTVLTMPDLKNITAEELIKFFGVNTRTIKAAQVFISMLPILVLYPFLQQYFTKGVVLGSVKG
ncbi:MAG TPA: carbohydrate ABC transporter permease [Ruminiclostridium sp.]|nr:carbohydrate ABC transporter permease [Ruminiclostridium sp.]